MIPGGQPMRYPFRAVISGFRWKRLRTDVTGTQKILLRTSDLAEAVAAVARVYCPHEVEIRGRSRGVIATLTFSRTRQVSRSFPRTYT